MEVTVCDRCGRRLDPVLAGMSATLWRFAGPDIADEAIVDYDRSVADVAELLGLEKRNYD